LARRSRGKHRNDVRLLQPRRQPHLSSKPLPTHSFGAFRRDDLHHYVAAERFIPCDEDARHPAAAKFALDGVVDAER
jgi:hypothetical protein